MWVSSARSAVRNGRRTTITPSFISSNTLSKRSRTSISNRFARSKFLLFKPGFLTREYLDGRRKPYVGPIQLFIIVNIVFVLLGPTTFRTPLFTQVRNPPFIEMKKEIAEEARAHRGMM